MRELLKYLHQELIDRLLRRESVEEVFSNMIGYIVTKEEYALLGKSNLSGWEKYRDANIKVYDFMEGV